MPCSKGLRLKREFASIWKHAELVGWETFLLPCSKPWTGFLEWKAGRAGGCFLHKVTAVGFEPTPFGQTVLIKNGWVVACKAHHGISLTGSAGMPYPLGHGASWLMPAKVASKAQQGKLASNTGRFFTCLLH